MNYRWEAKRKERTERAGTICLASNVSIGVDVDCVQGIKKGIMELVDLVIVNKADGPLRESADRAAAEYRAALHLLQPKKIAPAPPSPQQQPPHTYTYGGGNDGNNNDLNSQQQQQQQAKKPRVWYPPVITASAITRYNFPKVLQTIYEFKNLMQSSGQLDIRRGSQRQHWMWKLIQDDLLERYDVVIIIIDVTVMLRMLLKTHLHCILFFFWRVDFTGLQVHWVVQDSECSWDSGKRSEEWSAHTWHGSWHTAASVF